MAYDPGAIDAALAAAVGDEPGLIAELRVAFFDSAERTMATLEEAATEAEWREAAWRLKGLAASFGAVRLMQLAADAARGEPSDEPTLKRLRRAVERLA
jgi:histidine phosphotransfer protein HptB